jgi:DNA adenine methylase
MFSNKLYTPLRYPGGKAAFAPFVEGLMTANRLDGGAYLEPYAGGAGVALHLLFEGLASEVHINDFDPAIAAFWRVATRQCDELIWMVATEPITMEAWHHWRAVVRGDINASELHRGFATLFVNRTNRSGILKGGVIGGKEQAGTYQLDARFKREVLCARLERIGGYARRIHVYEEDAHALLRRCHELVGPRSLIYLDPPYYVKGAGLYRNFYEHDDHALIAELLMSPSFERHWLVSYDNVEDIRAMYAYARTRTYGLNYTAQAKYKGSEVMYFSDSLHVPSEHDLPMRAAA